MTPSGKIGSGAISARFDSHDLKRMREHSRRPRRRIFGRSDMRGIMCVVLIWGCVLGAQDGPPGPAFEVASVKHSQPIAGPVINGGSALRMDNAQAELRNLTLAVIVQIAYRLPPDQIKGPSWLQADRWACPPPRAWLATATWRPCRRACRPRRTQWPRCRRCWPTRVR